MKFSESWLRTLVDPAMGSDELAHALTMAGLEVEDMAPLHVSAPFSFEFREPLRVPDPMLVLDHVTAGYKVEGQPDKAILRNIKFTLQSGQRYGLLGINGAGKSTLIKTIAGELAPLSGTAAACDPGNRGG